MQWYATVLLALVSTACMAKGSADPEIAAWEQRARNVTIVRDDWGIPHIHGKTDADVVFGMIYAQAEDDFNRIETNYITALGRMAEVEGEAAIYRDLRMKLFVDPDSLKARYTASPDWLKALMSAWADGLNFYLNRHPEVTPKLIKRFEPWMALSFTEGSIGTDIEQISVPTIRAFYGKQPPSAEPVPAGIGDGEPTGSNGFAIAPTNTTAHKALFLINPHTSFFFRAELQVTSDEGLNAYGASTWGQFFIYQGFNARLGWMHTSSNVDAIDYYLETVTRAGDGFTYRYGGEQRPGIVDTIVVPFKTDSGPARRAFTVYRTHHGPVVGERGGQWITARVMDEPVKALTQSYNRIKTTNLQEFKENLNLHTNSSNNTVYADVDGNIAYFHANFIPLRDPGFDWNRPVDGTTTATEWGEPLPVDASPLVLNPPGGWLYNANDAPWWAAGPDSPSKDRFPAYVETGGSSPRGRHAVMVLENRKDFTLDKLLAAAYDSYLPGFADLIPPLLQDYDRLAASSPLKAKLAEPIRVLREWDYRWSANSVPTALAVHWGEALLPKVAAQATRARMQAIDYAVSRATAAERLEALAAAADTMVARFGKWQTPWGDINRFQRLTDDIVHPFADSGPSIPVPFTSASWGSLASFGARPDSATKKRYGTNGNSFVAVVEFGDTIRARAVTAGGESGNPASPHFNDQAERYAAGDLREVYFYPWQLKGHTEREYHPGE